MFVPRAAVWKMRSEVSCRAAPNGMAPSFRTGMHNDVVSRDYYCQVRNNVSSQPCLLSTARITDYAVPFPIISFVIRIYRLGRATIEGDCGMLREGVVQGDLIRCRGSFAKVEQDARTQRAVYHAEWPVDRISGSILKLERSMDEDRYGGELTSVWKRRVRAARWRHWVNS